MDRNTVFTYENSIGSLTFGVDTAFWLSEVTGASSVEVELTETRTDEQSGAVLAGQSAAPRSLTLDGCIFEPLQANRRQLLRVMAPLIPARLTKQDAGGTYWLDVVPQRTPEVSAGQGVQYFQAQLRACWPFWRTAAQHRTTIAGLQALFAFPFNTGGSWMLSQYSRNYFCSILNSGNVSIPFQVVFTAQGRVENPWLYHMGTRRQIRLQMDMQAGQQVRVSTQPGGKGVWLETGGLSENAFRHLAVESDLSMALLPGENLLRLGADSFRENLSASLNAPAGVVSGV